MLSVQTIKPDNAAKWKQERFCFMTKIGLKDENKWTEGSVGAEAFFLQSKRVAQGILGFKSAWRDGDSQSKPRHQPHVPEVPRTCLKQPEWQELSIYRRPVRKSVTALCRMQLMNCQVRHMPAVAPTLYPSFLPSLPHFLNTSLMRPAETGDIARDEMENTCPVRSATASVWTDKQEDQQVMKSERD